MARYMSMLIATLSTLFYITAYAAERPIINGCDLFKVAEESVFKKYPAYSKTSLKGKFILTKNSVGFIHEVFYLRPEGIKGSDLGMGINILTCTVIHTYASPD